MTIPVPHPQTFGWIKDALEGSMDAVMSQVVQVEREDDYALLESAPKNLHQIHGSLLMVELEAAGMLAQDLETLCSNISKAETSGEKALSLKAFRRGMAALQGYVDAIARQRPVSPLVLVDQINNVRGLIGGELITSFDLFEPPLDLLDVGEAGYDGKPIPADLRVRLVTQLRKKYRRALLRWLNGKVKSNESKAYLEKISGLLHHLGKVSSLDVSRQLWWVASGFVDAVGSGELDSEKEIKSQFARLDEEISRLEEESAVNIATDPPDDLLRKMLFYIGSVNEVSSDNIDKISGALELGKWFGGMDADYKAVVETSSKLELIKKEFSAKDFDDVEILVSESFAGYEGDAKDKILKEFGSKLGKLSLLAEQHNVLPIKGLVDHVINAVHAVDKSEESIRQTAADIKIASGLLFLRDIVTNPTSVDVTWSHSVDSHQEELLALIGQTDASHDRVQQVAKISQVEYQHARSAIVSQIRDTLSSVETSINMLRDSLAPEQSLREAADIANIQLKQIGASLGMVDADAAADLTITVSEVMQKLPTDGKSTGDVLEQAYEHLAFAIAALDVAAENISQREGKQPRSLLETAAAKLAEIDLSKDEFSSAGAVGNDDEKDGLIEKRSGLIVDLEQARQRLNVADVSSSSPMINAFSALISADGSELENHQAIVQLAQIGYDVTSQSASGDIALSTDKEDFLGLLVRQLRELHDSDKSEEIDIESWEERYAGLLSNEAVADDQEVSSVTDTDDNDESAAKDVDADAAGVSAADVLDNDLKAIFVEEYSNHIALLDNNFNKLSFDLDDESSLKKTVNEVEDCIHTLAGNCRNLGFDEAASCAEGNLPLLGKILANGGAPNAEFASMLDQSLSLLKDSRDQIKLSGKYDDDLRKQFVEQTEASRLVAIVDADLQQQFSAEDDEPEPERTDETPISSAGVGAVVASAVALTAVKSNVLQPGIPQPEPLEEATVSREDGSLVDDDSSEIEDDIDEEIREIFLEESETVLGRINSHLMQWRDDGANSNALGGIRREFHTLKGSAAATGYTGVSGLSHSIESMLDDIKPGQDVSDTGLLELLEEMHDGLAADLGFVPTDKKGHIAELRRKVARHLGEDDGSVDQNESTIAFEEQEVSPQAEVSEEIDSEPELVIDASAEQSPVTSSQEASVEIDSESELITDVSEEQPAETDPQEEASEEIDSESELITDVSEEQPAETDPQEEASEEIDSESELITDVSEEQPAETDPQEEASEEIDSESELITDVSEEQPAETDPQEEASEEIDSESELITDVSEEQLPETDPQEEASEEIDSAPALTADTSKDQSPETSLQEETSAEIDSEVVQPDVEITSAETKPVVKVAEAPKKPDSHVSKVFDGAAMSTMHNLSTKAAPAAPQTYAIPTFSRPPVKVSGEQIGLKHGGERMSWSPSSSLFLDGESTEDEVSSSSLRIESEKLAELINASGELGLGRNQLQNTLEATRMDLDLLRASMSTMREGLRDIEIEAEAQIRARPEQQTVAVDEEFDPLQLDRYSKLQAKSREVTELLDQLAKVERGLGNRASNLTGTLQQQQHLGQQLQSGLMSARMVAAGDYVPRLRYLVRESARQADKKVQLEFLGGDINIDRQVIESMMAPFEHMIRNAIAHGIEMPSERIAAGKPEQGVIKIELNQQGTELVVQVSDDGRGLDVSKLAAKAVELGLVDTASNISEVDMLQVVAQPGFSTAEKVSMESGRGVGMDVVYQAVRDLSGSMGLNNTPGTGVSFSFRLPVTLAVTQALLVKVGQWQFALRSRTVYRLVRVSEDEVIHEDENRFMMMEGDKIPLISLQRRLGDNLTKTAKVRMPVVVVRLSDRLAGFEVDDFGDAVDIVSKSAGRQLLSVPEFSGVTILGDNTITMVIDPEVFFDRYRYSFVSSEGNAEVEEVSGGLNRVLVVDDSLVVRKVMQRDLEADGLEVISAIDGVNALEILEENSVDVALVDIEMPRMNGYELLEKLRQDEKHQSLPVIIITSRSGDQHRERALSLGADGYITKPYNIGALDALMRQVIESRRTVH